MTVTEMLRPFVGGRPPLHNLQSAWQEFLFHLKNHQGMGLRGPSRLEDIERALDHVWDGGLEEAADVDPDDEAWIRGFEGREDVLGACRRFLEER